MEDSHVSPFVDLSPINDLSTILPPFDLHYNLPSTTTSNNTTDNLQQLTTKVKNALQLVASNSRLPTTTTTTSDSAVVLSNLNSLSPLATSVKELLDSIPSTLLNTTTTTTPKKQITTTSKLESFTPQTTSITAPTPSSSSSSPSKKRQHLLDQSPTIQQSASSKKHKKRESKKHKIDTTVDIEALADSIHSLNLSAVYKGLNKSVVKDRFNELSLQLGKVYAKHNADDDEYEFAVSDLLKALFSKCTEVIGRAEYLDLCTVLGLKGQANNSSNITDIIDQQYSLLIQAAEASSIVLYIIRGLKTSTKDPTLKQIYGEDLLVSIVNFCKTQVTGSLFGVLSHLSSDDYSDSVKNLEKLFDTHSFKKMFTTLLSYMTENLSRLNVVLSKESLPDNVIIPVVYTAIAPYFVEDRRKIGFEQIQSKCLDILILIFSRIPNHRDFILDEILSNIFKHTDSKWKSFHQFKFVDGKSIQITTALLLNLVQSSVYSKERPTDLKTFFKSQLDLSQGHINHILGVLFVKATSNPQTPSKKRSNETGEYRGILENLLVDLITCLNTPEFPAAQPMCLQIGWKMISVLDEKKGDIGLKLLSLEYLKRLCVRLKEPVLDEQVYLGDLDTICKSQKLLLESLDDEYTRQFYLCTWADIIFEADEPPSQLVELYTLQLGNRDKVKTEGDVRKKCANAIGSKSPLFSNFDIYFSRILACLDCDTVGLRSKALKCLQDVLSADQSVLQKSKVQNLMQTRLLDPSSSVRDSAVELLSKIVLGSDNRRIVHSYYDMLSARVLDIGVGVRKRIIKILKDIYLEGLNLYQKLKVLVHDERREFEIMSDIIVKLVNRTVDDEDTVRDLTEKTLREILFLEFDGKEWSDMSSSSKRIVIYRSKILVNAVYNDTQTCLLFGEMMNKFLDSKGGNAITNKAAKQLAVSPVCQIMIDCLIDLILESDKESSKDSVLKYLTLVKEFAIAFPTFFEKHIPTLQPYMKFEAESKKAEKVAINVVKVLLHAIPVANEVDVSLLSKIELDLISQVNNGDDSLINVAVTCLCSIVEKNTKNYRNVISVFVKCFAMLQKISAIEKFPVGAFKTGVRSLLILSLFARHLDLDILKHEMIELGGQPKALVEHTSIISLVYQKIMHFASSFKPTYYDQLPDNMTVSFKSVTLVAMGNLFIGYPKLMLREDARKLFDSVFDKSGSITQKNTVLQIFIEFLEVEQKRNKEKSARDTPSEINIEVLIGNADEMSEAGVSASIMQLYLKKIIECLHDSDPNLSSSAFECIKIILAQGLVHPMLCLPSIVSMESSPNQNIRDAAIQIHRNLNTKHNSIVHGKNADCVKETFEFQRRLALPNKFPKGFRRAVIKIDNEEFVRPEAHLNVLLQIAQEKRPKRNDLLETFVNFFDVDLKKKDTKSFSSIPFCKYLADNLSTFDYKTVDEVLHVLHHIYRVLSVTGESCLSKIHSWNSGASPEAGELGVYAHASVSTGIIFLLKNYLQKAYQITDARRQGYVPNSGSKSNEKPAVRQSTVSPNLTFELLPFAEKTFENEDDYWVHFKEFETLMNMDHGEDFSGGGLNNNGNGQDSDEDSTYTTVKRKKGRKSSTSTPSNKKRKASVMADELGSTSVETTPASKALKT